MPIANSLVTANLIFFSAYNKALEDAIAVLDKIAVAIDVNDRKCVHLLGSLFLQLEPSSLFAIIPRYM